MNTSSSSGSVLFGEPDDFSMDRTIDSDDCYSMVVLSYPDARSSDLTKIGTFLKQGHKTRQEDKLKLEETCVMVIGDELQFVHKQEGGNVNTNKTQRSFSLSKPARKKEYEELAVLHGKSEKVKRLLLPTISEPEWELV
ncbi:hypothetical protein Lalb_Chr19g0134941 [Lupinus albus]|uniref:Uncharacterized protein n=1 Tax=Lupinus albus TaxID=3870 RepID=A0A6A4NUF5_LUPAL|nr:hypothetical protein Lalb_Chr19g0134941 [Lupinus albus]